MRNFSGGSSGGFGGGRSGGGRGGFGGGRSGGRDGDRPSMHRATCSECGNSCEVPFRPTGEKPVYCNDCFGSKRASEERGGDRKDFGGRPPRREYGDRPMSSPSYSKPAPVSDETKKQLAEIIAKLDRLTSAIEKVGQPKAEAKFVEKPAVAAVSVKEDVKKKSITKVATKKVVEEKPVAKKVVVKKEVAKKKK